MRIRVGSFDSMTAMVAAGVGIGVMPLGVARVLAGGRRFRVLPIEGEWATRQFLLCHLPHESISSSALSVIELLAAPVSQNSKPA
jgi:DNA-binding transcriptional LysR family regulator